MFYELNRVSQFKLRFHNVRIRVRVSKVNMSTVMYVSFEGFVSIYPKTCPQKS